MVDYPPTEHSMIRESLEKCESLKSILARSDYSNLSDDLFDSQMSSSLLSIANNYHDDEVDQDETESTHSGRSIPLTQEIQIDLREDLVNGSQNESQEAASEAPIGDIPVIEIEAIISPTNEDTDQQETAPGQESSPQETENPLTNEEMGPTTSAGIVNFLVKSPKKKPIDTFKSIDLHNLPIVEGSMPALDTDDDDDVPLSQTLNLNLDQAPGPSNSVAQPTQVAHLAHHDPVTTVFEPPSQDDMADERGTPANGAMIDVDFVNNPCPMCYIEIEPIPEKQLSLCGKDPGDIKKETNGKKGKKRKADKSLAPIKNAKVDKRESTSSYNRSKEEPEDGPSRRQTRSKDKENQTPPQKTTAKADKKSAKNSEIPQTPKIDGRKLDDLSGVEMIDYCNLWNVQLKGKKRQDYKEALREHLLKHPHLSEANKRPEKEPEIIDLASPEKTEGRLSSGRRGSLATPQQHPAQLGRNRKDRAPSVQEIDAQMEVDEPEAKKEEKTPKKGRPSKKLVMPTPLQEVIEMPVVTNEIQEKVQDSVSLSSSSRGGKDNTALRRELEKYKKQTEEYKKALDQALREKASVEAERDMYKKKLERKEIMVEELLEKMKDQPGFSRSVQRSNETTPSPGVNGVGGPFAPNISNSRSLSMAIPTSQARRTIPIGSVNKNFVLVPISGENGVSQEMNGSYNGGVAQGYVVHNSTRPSSMSFTSTQAEICPLCSAGFTSREALQDHLMQVHPPEQTMYLCEHCNAEFDNKSHYQAHITYCSQCTPITNK